jgi:hypothetical protein
VIRVLWAAPACSPTSAPTLSTSHRAHVSQHVSCNVAPFETCHTSCKRHIGHIGVRLRPHTRQWTCPKAPITKCPAVWRAVRICTTVVSSHYFQGYWQGGSITQSL